ncbi:MAG: polyphosphate--glucose phosphotransferase [Nostocoides sp.]
MSSKGLALGIDVGGSGIKGAPVDLKKGEFAADRVRIDTPQPATPEAVCEVIGQIANHFHEVKDDSPIGVTIPGVVTGGIVRSAANIDKAWIDCDVKALLEKELGHTVHVVNDADAAGVAELHYGAADNKDGLIILTTLGTGIGTALLFGGQLVPNSELGHLELDGHDAETLAAASVKDREGISYAEWATRLQRYYSQLEALLWPDLFVVGGGVSKDADQFLPLLRIRTPIVPARLRNRAGIIGAAHLAKEAHKA